MSFRTGVVAAAAVLVSQPTSAADAYNCKMQMHGSGDWIPEILFIGHDRDAGRVVVSDPIILYFNNDRPVEGAVAVENDRRITYRWSIAAKDSSGRATQSMIYRATLQKRDGSMTISARPSGFDSLFTGSGTCSVEKIEGS